MSAPNVRQMSNQKNTFTEPSIINERDLSKRCYVTFYLNGERIREYNGKNVGISLNPNRAKSIAERQQLLKKLLFEIRKALEIHEYPHSTRSQKTVVANKPGKGSEMIDPSAISTLFKAVKTKLRSNLSLKYKRNLKTIYRQFRTFMSNEELNGPLSAISIVRIESFLNQYNSTGTYYMNKRRDLGVLFTLAAKTINVNVKTVQESSKIKSKAKLHKPYDKSQLKPILTYLLTYNPKLYLCCLLTYGAWLRPHEEVRLLTKGDFKKDDTEVHLSGEGNKGGKVRVVYIPEYAQTVIKPILEGLKRNENIFSLKKEPFNESYFNTAWSRAYKRMYALGLIYEDQTIYSFRHTAAIEVYQKTKDVYLLQKLLGHSSILVTLKYLRSLGEFSTDELRDAAPQL
ncbi:hypothetical protein DYU05_20555 [Mucilaginibacter terrenus]|uniref:Tyr recombinase domain-containing protein n=1 Tax=Mucilaginibacter terrenus TaxID=2482727 RepID=A0A3E2NJP0_9SPHI|nr:tyrosine-type recombinase/integrase [Mucilaginibacter terrenus]RFZ81151.1 hypothetical protein DYU05_20555 [Mucilaginibacter terrenus]